MKEFIIKVNSSIQAKLVVDYLKGIGYDSVDYSLADIKFIIYQDRNNPFLSFIYNDKSMIDFEKESEMSCERFDADKNFNEFIEYLKEVDEIYFLEKNIQEIKERQREKLKVGDYVVCTVYGIFCCEKDRIYQIKKINESFEEASESYIEILDDSNRLIKIANRCVRKATFAEMRDFLLKEANKKGFKIGTKVISKDGNVAGEITSFKVYYNSSKIISKKYTDLEKYSIYINIKEYLPCIFLLNDFIVDQDNNIIVKVNGVDYKAEFFKGYVKFGCATISNDLIFNIVTALNFNAAVNGAGLPNDISNRQIEAIQIGKGLFTKETLLKMEKLLIRDRIECIGD